MRTDQQIVDETNALALWFLNEVDGYEVPEGHKFYLADDPRSKNAWSKACKIQQIMTKTDPNDALSNLGGEEEPEPILRTYGVRLWATARVLVEDEIQATSLDGAIEKAKELDFSNYSFSFESIEGDESVSVFGPDDDGTDEAPWLGDGILVERHSDGEPLSWEAVSIVKELAELEVFITHNPDNDPPLSISDSEIEKIINLRSKAVRACTKITGGMEG